MKGCIVLYGESFRLGGQHSRIRGTPESYPEQMKASHSQMDFIHDVDADVYISSYTTPYTNDLLQVFQDRVIGYDFYESLLGQEQLIQNALQKFNLKKYDFLFILRIDLFLKPLFKTWFNPTGKRITWCSICFKPYHLTNQGHPRVNDMMVFIPKKYYTYLPYLHHHHDQWERFIQHTDLTYDDLDTILPTFHDSDSEKDWNPLYFIVNRKQSHIHHTPSETFEKHIIKRTS